jgi:1-aminocyclopropane-1-carboxylate deaminase
LKKIPDFLLEEDAYIIPEGGYGATGAKGASTILDFCNKDYTHYCCAVGTGTMMAGLINAAIAGQQVTGISVLKNNLELNEQIIALLNDNNKTGWQLLHDYHFGGYAHHQPALIRFMNEFYKRTKIPSDFVYTGKLFYAVQDLIEKDFFPSGSKVLVIHSGGLQGNESLNKGTLIF